MRWGVRRARALAFVVALALMAGAPRAVHADDTAEAGALFASGNQHLQAATRLRGERRTRELEAALADYVASLRIVRSRNVLFNASLAAELLERREDAFNYLFEYVGVAGLSESDRAEGTRRLDALRPHVAVLAITSAPSGAEVWIDRRDLAARGRTPLEYAVSAGDHRVWLRASGYRDAEVQVAATVGTTTPVSATLEGAPASVQVLAPPDVRLTLDGEPIAAGAHVEIAPGTHVARLEPEGAAPIERRFEVLPGAAPMVIDLATAAAGLARREGALLVVTSEPAARVMVDGLVVGGGTAVRAPVTSGAHEIVVEADGHLPYTTRHTFATGDRRALRVSLAPQRGDSLLAPRIVMGVAGGLSTIAVATTAIGWFVADERWDSAHTEENADEVEAWAYAAYTAWGVAAAVIATEIVLLIADGRSDEESVGELVVAPVPVEGGAVLSVGGRL
ncbi:PEGA domain-containing protein [Sandaracinus amylolyticus]|uniref:TonB-dependent receptor n=1 Tax=Sandaracinus amylolyticus TaxID=927083 RepID=A0A0F6SG53_9BACT|nr:PEGA domain-containing protein [Sandaracinus amylolyticus]AKF08094.1 TonB-dependent receptor [Sandaracinus amylolyticus]